MSSMTPLAPTISAIPSLSPSGFDYGDDFCPALLVNEATAETASELADLLCELLTDETVPEEMHQDTRSRLADLYRRFPESF